MQYERTCHLQRQMHLHDLSPKHDIICPWRYYGTWAQLHGDHRCVFAPMVHIYYGKDTVIQFPLATMTTPRDEVHRHNNHVSNQ